MRPEYNTGRDSLLPDSTPGPLRERVGVPHNPSNPETERTLVSENLHD